MNLWIGFYWFSLRLYFWFWCFAFSDKSVGLVRVQNLWIYHVSAFSRSGCFFQWGILFINSIIVLFPSFVIKITYSLPQVAVSTLWFYIFILNTEEMSNIFLQCVCLVKWSHENIWQHRCIRHRDSFVCFGWFCLKSLPFVATFATCHYFLCTDGSLFFQYKTITLAGVTTIHCVQDGMNPTPRMQGIRN